MRFCVLQYFHAHACAVAIASAVESAYLEWIHMCYRVDVELRKIWDIESQGNVLPFGHSAFRQSERPISKRPF